MGELVPVASTSGALIAAQGQDPEKDLEKRLQDAAELEEKLRKINEELPTRIYNVSGSCAGAGSGDFHYYRMIRRTEQDRQRRMDAEYKKQAEEAEFKTKVQQAQQQAEERTAKKRAKRQKKKDKRKQAKLTKTADGAAAPGSGAAEAGGSDSSDSEADADAGAPEQAALD